MYEIELAPAPHGKTVVATFPITRGKALKVDLEGKQIEGFTQRLTELHARLDMGEPADTASVFHIEKRGGVLTLVYRYPAYVYGEGEEARCQVFLSLPQTINLAKSIKAATGAVVTRKRVRQKLDAPGAPAPRKRQRKTNG